ncbi:MAG: hypothetical protein Q8O33_08445 [Pseudomonadota bacterium]|nr:hypothetical protein [Pseudomonadota bacterium]
MKTTNLVKKLGLITLTGLALTAASAQAHGWGGHNPTLPVAAHTAPHHEGQRDFGGRFGHDFSPRDDHYADIDQRQRQQMDRIRKGMASGQLSRHEARDLVQEQREIENAQRRYLADGRLNRDEWFRLDRMLDQAAANIHAEKHDRNRR